VSNGDAVRELLGAVGRGEFDAARALCASDVVLDWSVSNSPYGGVYEGPEAVEGFWRDYLGSWEFATFSVENLEEVVPNRVVFANRVVARGSGSGVEVTARGGAVWEFRDGLLVRATLYQSLGEARQAVGLEPLAR
jgi:ketosteroid isomerase-like protein